MQNYDPDTLWKDTRTSKIIQIYGSAGSGKSTLTMHFVKHIIKKKPHKKTFWIDTERKLTPKRLEQVIGDNSRSVFTAKISTYKQQENLIETLSKLDIPISAVVIDTISNHFRGLEKEDSWNSHSENLQHFYETHILPILTFQERTDCYLILVHQVSYVPDVGIKPFMHKVFEEIKSCWIEL